MRFFVFLFLIELLFSSPIRAVPTRVKYDLQKALLGKRLFFDPRLSKDGKISCASCHNPKYGGADNERFSTGVFGRKDTPMNAPTVYNAVFNCCQFWNGRAKDLKQQAIMAMENPKEMDMSVKEIEKAVNSIPFYKKEFYKVYGKKYITAGMVADAIAEFEKALVTPDSRFDEYLKGNKNALTPEEKRGYFLFKSYGCVTCHNGVNLGGNSFQKLGVFVDKINIPRGLDRYCVTHKPWDEYVYKVPTLRNVALTAPYFHDGSVETLKEAVILMAKFNLGIELSDKDANAIVAFLKTLTGKTPAILKSKR
jgi:cytochrome c peroxidase